MKMLEVAFAFNAANNSLVLQLEPAETGKASPPPTLLGKVGYAPNEQMRTGKVAEDLLSKLETLSQTSR